MNKNLIVLLLSTLFVLIQSCQIKKESFTELDKEVIINSAKEVVQKVFDSSNDLLFLEGLEYYSGNDKSYYVNNGTILSLSQLKESYSQIGSSVEVLENSIETWNATFLSKNTVAFTLPVNLKLKLKGVPEYNGQLVWTGVLKKEDGKWKIIQSHESWLNCVEVAKALTAVENK